MSPDTHRDLAGFIWSICDLLRGPYKRNEYRKVILPLTVLRRFECVLAPTRERVLKQYGTIKERPESVVRSLLQRTAGRPFYNLTRFDFPTLLGAPDDIARDLAAYINGFSANVREIMERFSFDQQIARMSEKNLLYQVIKAFTDPKVDLSPERVDNEQMGYVFEELIRIGAEQANEEAGEHFTPREVIRLMVNLLLSPERDLRRSHVVRTIYDPACGTGGMLSGAEQYLRELNTEARPLVFGQDYNDEAWAICKSDMLIKGDDADNIRLGDTFRDDGFDRDDAGRKRTFDYMLANPPFGVEWKQQESAVRREQEQLGHQGRFGAGLPRINDGSLLFLQHMLSKMRSPENGGSRIGIVFNGSPLFTGDAGSGESEIRRWIIENDWLEAVVALPDQLFYNTGIATYLWILTNRKGQDATDHPEVDRRGKVQLIDARRFFVKMRKSLGNKRNKIGDPADDAREPNQIAEITRVHGDFRDGDTRTVGANGHEKTAIVSRVFDNEDFGYHKITVERPLRLSFQVTPERLARLEEEPAFRNLATSTKKSEAARLLDVEEGQQRQQRIRALLAALSEAAVTGSAGVPPAAVPEAPKHGDPHPSGATAGGTPALPVAARLYRDRSVFLEDLHAAARAQGVRLTATEIKAIVSALGERDEGAEICRDRHGHPEPDPDLRDTENVPLKEDIETYFAREVLPHVPDAWIDHSKTKVGYEIPLTRHFYVYEPPRPLEEIEAEIKGLEEEILRLLREVTA